MMRTKHSKLRSIVIRVTEYILKFGVVVSVSFEIFLRGTENRVGQYSTCMYNTARKKSQELGSNQLSDKSIIMTPQNFNETLILILACLENDCYG